MLVQLVWTGQVMLWCMSRGSATESPAGHLISRHGPRTSLPFSQETRPQVPGSSLRCLYLKWEGAVLALRALHWSSIHCQQAKEPTSCSFQGAGRKSGWWQVLSPSCGATSGSVPTWSCGEEKVKSMDDPWQLSPAPSP